METKKRITKKESLAEMSDFLSQTAKLRQEVLVWEMNDSGSRVINDGHIDEILDSDGKIVFKLKNESLAFKAAFIYVHLKKENAIFKAELDQYQAGRLVSLLPHEIRFLGNENTPITSRMSVRDRGILNQQIALTKLDQEDQEFEGLREAPRLKPKEDKSVTIRYKFKGEHVESTHILHDLSQGGMGIIILDKEEFKVGSEIEILSLDNQDFDIPMRGIIRVVSNADDMGVQFKLGVQFIR